MHQQNVFKQNEWENNFSLFTQNIFELPSICVAAAAAVVVVFDQSNDDEHFARQTFGEFWPVFHSIT